MSSGLLINLFLAAIAIAFFLQFLSNKKHALSELKNYENHPIDQFERRSGYFTKAGNDLYDRLIINHRAESDSIRNKVDETVKNIYLSYLANPKYRSNIINYFARQQIIVPDAQNTLIMLVPSEKEMDEFKNLGDKYIKVLLE